MSESFIPKKNLVRGAMLEIMSAQYSLNMLPNPIPISEQEGSDGYISECDYNVQHAIEHLNATLDILSAIVDIDEDVNAFLKQIDNGILRSLVKYRDVIVKKQRTYGVYEELA